MKEFLQFSGGRVSTGILDPVMMVLMVNVLKINESFSKIFVSAVVMVGNYLISKLFVFKKDTQSTKTSSENADVK